MRHLFTSKAGLTTAALTALAALALADAAAVPALAASAPSPDWTITLGAEARVLPSYDGAANSVLRPFPIVRIGRAGNPARFTGVRDGASIGILDVGRFTLGPTVKIKFPRKESASSDLRGLGDIGWAVEAGGFAEFWPVDWLRARAELRQGFGGHHGLVSDLMADAVVPVTPRLTLSGGPRMTLASASATSPYFSVTAAQAAASGLPVYDAGGGLRSYGAGAQARYAWTAQWASHMFIEYERLAGAAGNAPLVTQRGARDQIQLGIGATYTFDIRGLW